MNERTPSTASSQINFPLLAELQLKPHPLLHIADDFERQIREIPSAWVGEVFSQARTVHHLLDIVGIPAERGYASDLDSRAYLATRRLQELSAKLDRIRLWHVRESGPGGTVGDYCAECGLRWPCDTRRVTDDTYEESSVNSTLSEE